MPTRPRCRCAQVVTGIIVWQLIEQKAGPLQRLSVLPTFFLGASEVASGVAGL